MKYAVMFVLLLTCCSSKATKMPDDRDVRRKQGLQRQGLPSAENIMGYGYYVVNPQGNILYSMKIFRDGRHIKIVWPKRPDNSQT